MPEMESQHFKNDVFFGFSSGDNGYLKQTSSFRQVVYDVY